MQDIKTNRKPQDADAKPFLILTCVTAHLSCSSPFSPLVPAVAVDVAILLSEDKPLGLFVRGEDALSCPFDSSRMSSEQWREEV